MNALQFKGLQEAGISEQAVFILEEVILASQNNLSTRSDIEITKLQLQKEIEGVRKEIQSTKLELQKEIEVVRKEIQSTKLELQKEIEVVRKDIELVRKDGEANKLELQKEIELVRKEIQSTKLELQKEIEVIRKEIQELKVDFHNKMNSQLWKIILLLISILSPVYVMLIRILLQLATFTK